MWDEGAKTPSESPEAGIPLVDDDHHELGVILTAGSHFCG